MNRNMLLAALLGSGLLVGSATGAELVVTGASEGTTSMFSMDVMASGTERGVQARIALPEGVKVDTSACLKALPAGFQGSCGFSEGEVRLMAFAFDDRKLPAGLLELGVIKVTGMTKGDGDVAVTDFQVVDSAGAPLQSKSTVSFGPPAFDKPGREQVR